MTSTDIQKELAANGTDVSNSTVKRMIHEVGYSTSSPRYAQMIREPNKIKRVEFCKNLISVDEHFNDIVFTDECTVQLHDNKIVVYRLKDSAAPPIPLPKHAFKVYVWGGISHRGSTRLLIFDGILKSNFFVEEILQNTLLPFIRFVFPAG